MLDERGSIWCWELMCGWNSRVGGAEVTEKGSFRVYEGPWGGGGMGGKSPAMSMIQVAHPWEQRDDGAPGHNAPGIPPGGPRAAPLYIGPGKLLMRYRKSLRIPLSSPLAVIEQSLRSLEKSL